MNKKFAPIALMFAVLFGTTVANAQAAPAAGAAKSTIIDAAVTDNVYQLYEGEVVKVDKKTRTITFKNKEGESKFVAGPDIKNFDQIKKVTALTLTTSWQLLLS